MDSLDTYFQNCALLRMEMHNEKNRFIDENRHRFQSDSELQKAVNNHLNRKYRIESEKLISKRMGLINSFRQKKYK